MPALVLLGLLGLNYHRHKHGKSTICSSTRPFIPASVFVIGWGFLTAWIVPHYTGWRPLAWLIRLLQAFDDNRPEIEETP